MFKRIRRSLAALRHSTSGNTAIMVAAGMPALIGGAGLAVDTSQWYMWRREMQYAVDQAALAGAWSKVKGSEGTEYQTRAQQELTNNLQIVDFHGEPTISLAGYAGGTDNSVVVTLSASKTLPFTSIITNDGVTVAVRAQAHFQAGRTFTSCLIAVDPDTKGAITISGNAYIVARCGAAALSNDAQAVTNDGNAVFDVGWIVSAGGIDDDFNDDPGTQIFENQEGLVDPFADLVPPDDPTPQTYTCSPATTVYTATYTETKVGTLNTYEGATVAGLALVSTTSAGASSTATKTKVVDSKTKVGDSISATNSTGPGTVTTFPKTITTTKGKTTTTTTATWYRRIDTVTATTGIITAISAVTTPGGANVSPGTYSDFRIGCATVMSPGVYVIDGGLFETHSTYSTHGDGVMIVLRNGAGIRINGSSDIFLEAMTFDEMRSFGHMTEEQALNLKDILIFEDPDSEGDDNNRINGTSGTVLNGTVYLPNSTINFNGTAQVTSGCLVLAARRIHIGGTTNMTSFCSSDGELGPSIGGGAPTVKLVA